VDSSARIPPGTREDGGASKRIPSKTACLNRSERADNRGSEDEPDPPDFDRTDAGSNIKNKIWSS
jgi:hypothetical protein